MISLKCPDQLIQLLVLFLEQNNGTLSKRTRGKGFSRLSESEVIQIEELYKFIFHSNE